jgi:hypothetical protein
MSRRGKVALMTTLYVADRTLGTLEADSNLTNLTAKSHKPFWRAHQELTDPS